MNKTCDIESVNEAFRPAREHLETIIRQLHTDPTAQIAHDQLESLIEDQGTETMRLLLQGHQDMRAAREPRLESVAGADGFVRTHCRKKGSNGSSFIMVSKKKPERFGIGSKTGTFADRPELL